MSYWDVGLYLLAWTAMGLSIAGVNILVFGLWKTDEKEKKA